MIMYLGARCHVRPCRQHSSWPHLQYVCVEMVSVFFFLLYFCKVEVAFHVEQSFDLKTRLFNVNFPESHRKLSSRFSGSLDDGRSSSHSHSTQQRRSPGNSLKRPRYLVDDGGSRNSLKSNGEEDVETLRHLLIE